MSDTTTNQSLARSDAALVQAVTFTPAQFRDHAEGCEREARALDAESPEPDGFCSARGGDGHRTLAAMLRYAATVVEARETPKTCETCQHYAQDPHRMSGPCAMGVRFDLGGWVPHNFGCILYAERPGEGE